MTAKKPAAKKLVQQSPSPSKSEQLAATDDLPPSPSTIAKIIAEWRVVLLSLLFVVSFVGQHFGWWTPEQGQHIRDVIPVAAQKPEAVVAAISPDVQALIDSLKAKLDELTRKLDEQVEPDPTPDPAPQPQPTSLAIHIHDKTGQLLTDPTIDAGQLIRVSSVGSVGPIEWLMVPSGTVDMSLSTDKREFAGTLRTSGDWCHFVLIDWGAKSAVSMRIACNKGPQPPPPPVPDPMPDPQPDPTPVVTKVNLRLVYEPSKATPELTSILNHSSYWVKFRADGNNEAFYTAGTQNSDGLKAIEYAKSQNVPMPFIVIEDRMTSKPVKAFPVPATIDEIAKLIGK